MSDLPLPLNQEAVKAADDEFYSKHPELIGKNGERVPIHPTKAEHTKERDEWIDLYKKHSGEREDASPKQIDPPDKVANSCPPNVLIYLLFYVTKNARGDAFFAEAAQTRLQNIKGSKGYDPAKHKVHCPPIQDLGEIATIVSRYIAKYGGVGSAYCKEVGVFSHSGLDGPVGSHASSVDPAPHNQMGMTGWGSIDFNWWSEKPLFAAYGCNSANEIKSFAQALSKLANFSGVETWGQSSFSYPSFLPDYRVTTVARSLDSGWSVGATYQVGGTSGEGWKATSPSSSYPQAKPMNCYRNGEKIRSTHQGYYNDHRVVFTLVAVP